MNFFIEAPYLVQLVVVLITGLSFGSFANVCIYRLPRKEPVISSRSRCPSCNSKITAWDNVPIFSYFLLKGKCRQCAVAIPILYPVIEAGTAFLIILGFIKFGVSSKFFIFCIVGPALVIITAIDIKHKIIPNAITLPAIVFGLVAGSYLLGFKNSIIGLFMGGGIFLITSEIYYRIRGRIGIGGGDIKFISAVGALLGWQQLVLIIFLSSLIGSIVGLTGIVTKKINLASQIPFGPFLAFATLLAYFLGEQIIYLYVTKVTGGL